MNERVTLGMKEIKRLYIMQQVEDKKMTGLEASQHLDLTLRQVRRLIAKYRAKGAAGLIHGNRGRAAHNRIEAGIRVKIQGLAQEEYKDYNDSHFTEELIEEYGLQVSRSTVRRIRREMGQKSPRKHHSPRHRGSRERKEKAGLMLQADGSRHDWLEGRGPWLTLIGYIDDATSEVVGAVFREEEDALGYFLGLQEICLRIGIPAAIYADRHTIFQSPSKATIEQELAGEQPKSQYGRLLDELSIQLIAAQSPQAKGRVERLWGTLQDRLVKELRKKQTCNLEQANQVLKAYLPRFNQHFRVPPAQSETGYLPWPKEYRAKDFFCFKHMRTVANDNTFPFDKHRFQIPPGPQRRSYAKLKVEVRQHLDGQLEVRYQGHSLATFTPSEEQPLRVKKFSPAPGQEAPERRGPPITVQKPDQRIPHKPAADHPWRKPFPAKPKENKV